LRTFLSNFLIILLACSFACDASIKITPIDEVSEYTRHNVSFDASDEGFRVAFDMNVQIPEGWYLTENSWNKKGKYKSDQ
jgi:hypothetical protein